MSSIGVIVSKGAPVGITVGGTTTPIDISVGTTGPRGPVGAGGPTGQVGPMGTLNVAEVTEAQFASLNPKVSNTIYVIT